MIRQALFGLIGLGLGIAAPALAQDANARAGQVDGQLVLEAQGHQFFVALPAWFAQNEDMTLDDQELIISGDKNSTRFEILPKGQNADSWTHMYGARIVLEPERDLAEYRSAAAYGYALTCHGETGQYFLADQDTDEQIAPLIFICGRFVPEAGRPGEGEIMVMAFRRTDKGIAVVYEEFRTRAFNGKDQAAWPISGPSMVERANQLLASAALEKLDN